MVLIQEISQEPDSTDEKMEIESRKAEKRALTDDPTNEQQAKKPKKVKKAEKYAPPSLHSPRSPPSLKDLVLKRIVIDEKPEYKGWGEIPGREEIFDQLTAFRWKAIHFRSRTLCPYDEHKVPIHCIRARDGEVDDVESVRQSRGQVLKKAYIFFCASHAMENDISEDLSETVTRMLNEHHDDVGWNAVWLFLMTIMGDRDACPAMKFKFPAEFYLDVIRETIRRDWIRLFYWVLTKAPPINPLLYIPQLLQDKQRAKRYLDVLWVEHIRQRHFVWSELVHPHVSEDRAALRKALVEVIQSSSLHRALRLLVQVFGKSVATSEVFPVYQHSMNFNTFAEDSEKNFRKVESDLPISQRMFEAVVRRGKGVRRAHLAKYHHSRQERLDLMTSAHDCPDPSTIPLANQLYSLQPGHPLYKGGKVKTLHQILMEISIAVSIQEFNYADCYSRDPF
ncbi:hypothetical protein QR680_010328 [Steinernema hermaphroditum]|uniref:Uncharacterized protein n=1 Tax=Steinernema hermaphroditum TaxID=289476 RepID=A0AA39IQ75_9BILA|nr:hypothetical protein QR680_010328 [Steinernema hermaphroditum]